MLPHRCIQNAWIGRVHPEVGCPGLCINAQDLLPGFAPVCRAIHATFFVGSPDLTLCPNIGNIRIRWVNLDARNLPCFRQSDVRPSGAGVR